jgi:NAD(P)-dependent dehydrogenase (short-subunit alcohol dehydrogenase family)
MVQKTQKKKPQRPAQRQRRQPGLQSRMRPQPKIDDPKYRGSGKLKGQVALITGGDSGIGAAAAIAMAKEGAHVAIVHLNEHQDADNVRNAIVRRYKRKCIVLAGDVGSSEFCASVVKNVIGEFSRLDILVNNAAEQHEQDSLEAISDSQLERTFRTNIFSYFYMARAAMPFLKRGSAIVNTTSVTAYRGSSHLIDYASTKAAIVGFTRSLASAVVEKGIRVNGVAPGPVWTPLIPATFSAKDVAKFGSDAPMGRAAEPCEIAPAFVFLASSDSSYITGQVLHPNGGEIING